MSLKTEQLIQLVDAAVKVTDFKKDDHGKVISGRVDLKLEDRHIVQQALLQTVEKLRELRMIELQISDEAEADLKDAVFYLSALLDDYVSMQLNEYNRDLPANSGVSEKFYGFYLRCKRSIKQLSGLVIYHMSREGLD